MSSAAFVHLQCTPKSLTLYRLLPLTFHFILLLQARSFDAAVGLFLKSRPFMPLSFSVGAAYRIWRNINESVKFS